MTLFLKLKNNSIASQVTEGSGKELEIPCEYIIEGDTKTVDWILQTLKKITKLCKNLVAVNRQRKSQKWKLPESQDMAFNVQNVL